ncbi:CPBP family intramembrane glutamic endopeptidase [Pseudoclavibacter sp. VKM Ac-2867]|uniref:CPBP family intramembrane glutamic endopeptidase n=1 Tax=Pseudoclavibacter sp. VKM Ac-2867 TaxID=2783829 RepID=UPI00188B6848|nr:type II CAAX endopeptidase family protein [Pseudoclavibacter sp. VKM Ac-2867]MBF4457448.1 CPBP family intramembrane metalloprotease [Pseudoclavibacter sp. VKM Ac-2867]
MPDASTTESRIRPRIWIGVLLAIVYAAVAGGVANMLTEAFPQTDPAADFALGHFPVLIPLVVGGVLFIRWAGWSERVWRTPAAFETTPRRWWMLAIPVLLLAQAVLILATMPAERWQFWLVLLIALGTGLVGFGEELYFRGILRASLLERHGETLALVVTSLAFGAAHSLGSLIGGVPLALTAFQVAATAFDGMLYYGVFLATGRLWVPIALHAITDFSLRVAGGLNAGPSADIDLGPATAVIEIALGILAFLVLISCIRRDLHQRRSGSTLIAS